MEIFKPGQIVKIRHRFWRIDSVFHNEISATSIDSYNSVEKRFYSPIEDIQLASTDRPDIKQIGSLEKQYLFLTSHQLSLIHGTSPLLSMQRSAIIPTNFQLVPVIMALNSPRVRLLIADDVGLGKTIEAGLIVNELIARHLIRKILIICPASLREQWQEAMRFLFKQDFRIISSLHRKYLEKELPIGASPWEYFNHLITSIDYAKTPAHRNELLSYNWDLVIVDEAHLGARPHLSAGGQHTTMYRWELLERISQKTKHLLLLTATPHNGYSDSFASLLEVLDVGAVRKEEKILILREKAIRHVCQRTRDDVKKWLASEPGSYNPFPEKDPDKKEVPIDLKYQAEQTVLQKLTQYANHMTERAFVHTEQRYMVTFLVLHLMKRAISSPHALRESLRNRINKLKSRIEEDTEIKNTEARTTIAESDQLESGSPDEAGRRLERTTFDRELIEYEIESLEKTLDVAKRISPKNDSKYQTLISTTLPELLKNSPKIILFTRYLDTVDYLKESMLKDYQNVKILTIHGEMNMEKRKDIFVEFGQAEKAVLIATDCISEGINLQYLSSQIIHYELPWNPNRMEQRNGRVDRFGQPADQVHIRTMMVNNTLDEIILKHIIEKADRIRRDYGFSPPFLGDENQIVERLIRVGRTPNTRFIDNTDQLSIFGSFSETDINQVDLESDIREQMEKIRDESFYGQSHITLPDIERKLRETEKTIGSEESIGLFIRSSLNLFNCPIEKSNEKTVSIHITDQRLLSPGMDKVIPEATFDKTYAAKHPGVELIDISHPLVSRLIQILKQQSTIEKEHYGRTAYKGSSHIKHTIAILKVLVRYVVNTTPNSIVEEIIPVGFRLFSKEILSDVLIHDFETEDPKPIPRTDDEVREDLAEVFSESDWEKALQEKIETNRRQMIIERQNLIDRLDYSDELPEWLNGVTDIQFARYDILTITLGYPV